MAGNLFEDRLSGARGAPRGTAPPELELMLRSTDHIRQTVRRSVRVNAPEDLVARIRELLDPRTLDYDC